MKNLYLRRTKVLGLFSLLFLCAQITMAQVDILWNGSISSAAEVPQNWTPENPIAGNNLEFQNSGSYTHPCVITGTEDITVAIFNMNAWSSTIVDEQTQEETVVPVGEVTINMAEGTWFTTTTESDQTYHVGNYIGGILNITGGEGNFSYAPNKNFYMDNDETVLNINCDTVTFKHWVGFGDRNGTKGGQMNISGHSLVTMGSIDRIPTALGRVHLFIGDDAELRVNTDRTAYLNERITAGSIATDPDKDLVVKYDPYNDITTITTRLKTAFVIEPTDRQLLTAGVAGSEVAAVENDGLASMVSLEWVYGTVDGTYDQTFSPSETNSTIIPTFQNSGTFYMALKGNDGSTDHYSNSIEVVVSSNKALLSPTTTQNIRVGQGLRQEPFIIEVLETPAATSREWKYSTTPGGPYEVFDPAITGAEFSAPFTEAGTYFVICESTIDGVVETTKEVQVNMLAWNSGALNLTFTGANSTDGRDIFNWDPAAYVHKNNLSIPAGETVEINGFNKDTIASIWIETDALAHLTGSSSTDTLWYRSTGEWDDPGSWLISKGVFIFPTSYFRMYKETQTFTLENDAKAVFDGNVLLGNSDAPAVGANLIAKDNAVMLFNTLPGRVSANAGYSEFRMEGNGKYLFAGDVRGSIATWVNGVKDAETGEYTFNPKFITPDGTVPYMVYDPNENLTSVSIRNLSDFGVEQTKTQIVGKGQGTNPLTLINSGAYSSFEWKYSTTTVGPWESFDTPVTGASASVSFATPGTYYVVCVGDALDVTSNAVPVKVVDVSVTPSADQYIDIDADGTELSYTLPDGATGVQWKYATVSGGPYEEFLPAEIGATYLPWGDEFLGKHFIVYEATVTDDDGQQVTVYSNEVTIFVGATAIGDVEAQSLVLYPNPSNGNFNIELEEGASHTITVYNAVGNVVLNKETTGGIVPVSIQGKGIYLVEVASGSSVKVERVVVK
ncbi:T9SS type A sorting domain-containing protein [Plebeiibacterium marinum]|uniref:T9SS type A sorting domain-containing protein n=1 Tax=Plebeiibacterium marinum TaxID=2992111 RepID=A0AAE3MH65_9BACT|nr:T9SS type A sorting domain-containing protein [Plebeiobacterium marinum]MCW3807763.1 T9SS type A sorting domain-containing protein [Plebeiobacterium marinum]